MKAKYLFIGLAVASLFSACSRDEESLFDKSAAERAQWTLDNAKQVLISQQNGWEMLYFANRESRGYNVVVKFHENGKVVATANNALTTQNQILTDSSTWLVKNDYGPIISFDTYNEVLHAWADPDPTPEKESKDYTVGDGYLGDYEFLLLEANANRVVLKGKKHAAYTILRPMPSLSLDDYFTKVNAQLNNYFSDGVIMTLQQDGESFYLHNGATGIFTKTPLGEPVPEVDPEIYPICPTLDGFVVCNSFNSETYLTRGAAMEHLYTLTQDKFVGEQGSIISSGDLYLLFMTYISNNKGWKADVKASTGAFADAANAFTEALIAQTKDSKAKLSSVGIIYVDSMYNYKGSYVLRIKSEYKNNGSKQTQTTDYVISVKNQDQHITLSYIEPANTTAATWYERIPALANLINATMGSFTLSTENKLNPMRDMRLNNASSVIVTGANGNMK